MTSESRRNKRPSTTKDDHYTVLGVSRTATDAEIKQAYRRLALQFHPDKNTDPDATARFQAIAKAYKILGDPKLRSTYDLLGSQAADMIDQYEEYPGTYSQLSRCKKVIYALLFLATGCGCCCICGFVFCGCFCCCHCCCNRCCGLCKKTDATVGSEEDEANNYSFPQHTRSSVRQQPTNTTTDATRF